jgi:hypothetical protein
MKLMLEVQRVGVWAMKLMLEAQRVGVWAMNLLLSLGGVLRVLGS